jgi:hypothetical protein
MLMSVVIKEDEDSRNVEIETPKFTQFIHSSYVEACRVLYDNYGVLDPDLPSVDKLRIRGEIFNALSKATATALRMMVPLDSIAPYKKSDLADVSSDEESSGSEESDSEDQSDSSESDSYGSSLMGSESESESESGIDDYSESEDEAPRRKKKVHASRRALNTPDDLD